MRGLRFLVSVVMATVLITSYSMVTGARVGTSPAQAAGSVSLATWSSNPTEQAGQKKLVSSFQNKYGINIDFQVINGTYPTVLKARFTAGTAPDVFYVNSDYFQDFASSGG